MPEKVTVEVGGRQLQLSNLHKVLYPQGGFTKGAVIDYYTRVAPVLLPHLADRALTIKRYPNGVDEKFFFEKNAARGTPDWVRTVNLPVPGSTKNRDTIDYIVVEELATLVWLANLAALELHVPQWRVAGGHSSGGHSSGEHSARRARKPRTDVLVFDLDPGAPAAIAECCEVALLLRDLLADDGVTLFAKTSGSKGMQVSAPIDVDDPEMPSTYAHAVARQLEAAHPELVVSRMTKSLRGGKVLVDWSQNNPAKTTIAPYSLRARDEPTVSAPLTWDEVESGGGLRFTSDDVLRRVEEQGDLFEGTLDDAVRTRITPGMATRG